MRYSAFLLLVLPSLAVADEPISFNRDIRPILSDKCFACHGFDAKKRQADLRLDTLEGATADHDGKRAVVASDLAKSELWSRINHTDPDQRMPPADSNKTLSDKEKDLFKRWIEQGAAYQKHWSFEPIRKPELPTKYAGKQPADAFLLAKIESAGLAIEPEADRETLIRRVAFTLTGLPPAIAEVDEYLADTSPQAYERMVDRYLASQRYGEEMAKHWLDAARYADTHGLHLDNERQMWAYRDWVIKAFNQNLPFDQFTVWQLAGDQLPQPTQDQLIATGFNRCNVTTGEGGTIEAEFLYRYAVERASSTATVWLGLTAGCAVCHDHKYDPLSQKEFYSLYSFFYSSADPALDGNTNNTAPFAKLPSKGQQAAAEAAAKVEREARAWLETAAGQTEYRDPVEVKDLLRKAVRDTVLDDVLPLGAASRSTSRNAVEWIASGAGFQPASERPMSGQAGSLPHLGQRVVRQAFASNYTDTFDFKLNPPAVPHDGVIEANIYVDDLEPPKSISLTIQGGKPAIWQPSANSPQTFVRGTDENPLTAGKWNKVSIPAADLGLNPSDKIASLILNQNGGLVYWDGIAVVGQSDPAADPLESLTAWRKSLGKNPPPELPEDLKPLIQAGPEKQLSDEEAAKLRRFYLAVVARPQSDELAAARTAWEAARTSRIISEESPPGTFIFRDLDKPRESFVMLRGQYDKPGDKVEPAVPAILPPIKAEPGQRLTRLDLAKWLVSDEQPLTARVMVNRLWQQVFGTGLVKTSYDFGSQGAPPSHPELLDYLSADFRESKWDIKRLMKQLLLSDAFRRSARATAEARAKDPDNRLYARGPRFRLDAEQVRDNALFVSGLINLQMGGRGVKTYQPPNIWEPVGYSDSNTRFYLQDHGPSLYRRTIYAFLKRTAPPPFMSNFDGPNREQVCMVRERSNTPLQALQLMNDVQHFEAARSLAEKVIAGAATPEERVAMLYRTVLSRRPDAEESQLMLAALAAQRELYNADPEAAKKVIAFGESKPKGVAPPEETAAWAMIANLVLNLDETLNRN
jgi:hypothetical protein